MKIRFFVISHDTPDLNHISAITVFVPCQDSIQDLDVHIVVTMNFNHSHRFLDHSLFLTPSIEVLENWTHGLFETMPSIRY